MGNSQNKVEKIKTEIDENDDDLVTKEELRAYFEKLADKIDKNNDGIITNDELEQYVNNKLSDREKEVEKYKTMYDELLYNFQLLEEKYKSLKANRNVKGKETERLSFVSTKALQEYIQKELIESDANITWIPDAVEKKAYLGIYKTAMEAVEKLANTTSIEILNHKLSFHIEPTDNFVVRDD